MIPHSQNYLNAPDGDSKSTNITVSESMVLFHDGYSMDTRESTSMQYEDNSWSMRSGPDS